MLETLKPVPPDKIIEILNLFRADPRTDKLDLGVGVYKDAQGRTPVMRSVKAAEARLLARAGQQGLCRHPRRSRLRRRPGRARARRRRAARPARRGADAGGDGGDPPALRADRPGRSHGHGLDLGPDLAQPSGDPRLSRHPHPQLPLLRRRQPRGRLRGHDGRPRGARGGRRAAAARLLPQPDGGEPVARGVAGADRASCWRRARCR